MPRTMSSTTTLRRAIGSARLLVLAALTIATFTAAAMPQPARAAALTHLPATTSQQHQPIHYLQPGYWRHTRPQARPGAVPYTPTGNGNLNYGGGNLLHSPTVYALFWGNAWTQQDAQTYNNVVYFLRNELPGSPLMNILTQYYDNTYGHASNTYTFGAAYIDTSAPTTACGGNAIANRDLFNEINAVVYREGWFSSNAPGPAYLVFTPSTNVVTPTCSGQACGFHNLVYGAFDTAFIPFPAPGCRPYSGEYATYPNDTAVLANVITHELFETITDSSNGWVDSSGQEIGDKCGDWYSEHMDYPVATPTIGLPPYPTGGITFGSDTYPWMQTEYSNALSGCVSSAPNYIDSYCSGTTCRTVAYDAHVQSIGWQPTKYDSDIAGTTGQSLRMEAIQIWLQSTFGASICYQAHVQNIGWQGAVCNGAVAGTTGQSLRMEALKIWLSNAPPGSHVCYEAHVQNTGWQYPVCDGGQAGTTGQSLRMEAIQIWVTYP